MSEHKWREKNVFVSPILERASENDRRWFLAYPQRSYRLRWEDKGEAWNILLQRRLTLVHQIVKGIRLRKYFVVDDEEVGQNLIDLSEGKVFDCPDGKPVYVNDDFLETLFDEGWLPLRHPEKDGTDGIGMVLERIPSDEGKLVTFDEAAEAAKRNAR